MHNLQTAGKFVIDKDAMAGSCLKRDAWRGRKSYEMSTAIKRPAHAAQFDNDLLAIYRQTCQVCET